MARRASSGWVWVWLLAFALPVAACSDTTCREKLGPDGTLVQSDQCTVGGAGQDAGEDNANSANNANNNANNANNAGEDVGVNNSGDDAGGGNNGEDAREDAPADDVGGGDDVGGENNGTPQEDRLLGDWISQGDDLAPLLREGGFGLEAALVTFEAREYVGELQLESGDAVPYGGTYMVDRSTTPWAIVLTQTAPQALTSRGIVEVVREGGAEVMRLEVVQVEPPTPGFQPPTPQGGFGSTRGIEDPEDNIQIYRRP